MEVQDKQPILSEDAILGCLAEHFHYSHPRVALGRGDDCSIFRDGTPLCVSSDLFLEDSHFRRSYFTPEETGYKALAVNLSDMAANGAKPVAFQLCLGLPDWVDLTWLNRFFAGMAELANAKNITLAGGDLSCCQKLHISITIIGESLDVGGFLTRGGSMDGDVLFVVGSIGLARIGFEELEKHGRAAMESWPAACAAHLRPVPQTSAGLMLARAALNARPPTLMDLSDGILQDLPRLLGKSGELGSPSSKIGADIVLGENALHEEVIRHAEMHGEDPGLAALRGGEDYSLLGACSPGMYTALHAAIPGFQSIGQVTASGRILYNGRDITGLRGFDHFYQHAQQGV